MTTPAAYRGRTNTATKWTAKAYMFYFNNVMYFQVKRVLKKNKTGQGILYI